LSEWYTTSHEAENTISRLRTSLYAMDLTPAWNGTYYSFFRNFHKKVHGYHRLVDVLPLRIPDLHVSVDNMADFVLLKRHASVSATATFDEVLAVTWNMLLLLTKLARPNPSNVLPTNIMCPVPMMAMPLQKKNRSQSEMHVPKWLELLPISIL
jgi:hypothetical protein